MVDQHGHAVGVLTDICVDDVTGRPEWGAVRTGVFSHPVTFVPLSQATSHGLRVQLPCAQAHIYEAPNIEPHGHLSADEEARLYQHYGLDYDLAGDSGSGSGFVAPATDKVDEAREGRRRRRRRHGAGE